MDNQNCLFVLRVLYASLKKKFIASILMFSSFFGFDNTYI